MSSVYIRMTSSDFTCFLSQEITVSGLFSSMTSAGDLRSSMNYLLNECAICNIANANIYALKISSDLALQSATNNIEKLKGTEMSIDELAAIKLYTTTMYPVQTSLFALVNTALLSVEKNNIIPYSPYIWLLMHALRKAPMLDFQNRVIIHVNKYTELNPALLRPDAILTCPIFLCCTSLACYEAVAPEIKGPYTKYIIETTTNRCRDISEFSMRGEPGDYLFPPNTRFRVMSIQSSTPNEPAEARLIELPPVDPILSFEREPAMSDPDQRINILIGMLKDQSVDMKQKERAVASLCNLAVTDLSRQRIVQLGGLQPLLSLLTYGTMSVREKAVTTIQNLSVNSSNREAIYSEGGLNPIIYLLTYGSPLAKERAAGAVANLAVNVMNKRKIAEIGGLPPLIDLLTKHDVSEKSIQSAAIALSNLAVNDQNRIWIPELNGIQSLIHVVSTLSFQALTREYAAGAIKNLSHRLENRYKIVECGGIPPLIALLLPSGSGDGGGNTNTTNVAQEYAAGALQFISNVPELGVEVANHGGIGPLVSLYVSSDMGVAGGRGPGSGITPKARDHAITALRNLSINEQYRAAIRAFGGGGALQ